MRSPLLFLGWPWWASDTWAHVVSFILETKAASTGVSMTCQQNDRANDADVLMTFY
jgi:hypothetical protein